MKPIGDNDESDLLQAKYDFVQWKCEVSLQYMVRNHTDQRAIKARAVEWKPHKQ
jgi:hypothetical protein